MSEFVNRMAVQREVLRVVNEYSWNEQLFGLSSAAIRRWAMMNEIAPISHEVELLEAAGEALNFLATRSQDQISSDYEEKANQVRVLTSRLRSFFGERRADDSM